MRFVLRKIIKPVQALLGNKAKVLLYKRIEGHIVVPIGAEERVKTVHGTNRRQNNWKILMGTWWQNTLWYNSSNAECQALLLYGLKV